MTLQLDDRQRAMLGEMGVTVWAPRSPASPAASSGDPPSRPAVDRHRAAPAPAMAAPVARVAEQDATAPIDALDWAGLHAAVSGCQACALRVGCKAPVMEPEPQPRQADWLVVGDPPDEDEERAGTAFAGACGELLDNMLRAVQVSRGGLAAEGAHATNVVKCRSGLARNPTSDELAACSVYLRREVALVRPRVILAMGRFAALSLLGGSYPDLPALPFAQWRGKVYSAWGVPVVVTYHPAKLLRAPQGKAHAWADLCLAQSVARQPVSLPDAQPGPRMDPPSP